MLPPNQGLKPADLAAGDIDDRLIVEFELAGDQGPGMVLPQPAPSLHLFVHFHFKEAVGAASVTLGAIERQISVPDQLLRDQAVRAPGLCPSWYRSPLDDRRSRRAR